MTKRKIETIAITAGRNFDTQIGAVMPPIQKPAGIGPRELFEKSAV